MFSSTATTAIAGVEDATAKLLQAWTEAPANGNTLPVETRRILEQEYIELLKEKIVWLEKQLNNSKDHQDHQDNETRTSETTIETRKKENNELLEDPEKKTDISIDEKKPGSKTRVRYIKRFKRPRISPKNKVITKNIFKDTTIRANESEDNNSDNYAIS
jgi:hypothetical protein